MNEAFIWNLVFVGAVITEYERKYPELLIEWSIPEGNLDTLILYVGTKENPAIERKYLKYYDIEELEPYDLRQKVENMLYIMMKKILPL